MLLVRPILTAPTVTLLIAQVLHREYASFGAAISISTCWDAECIPGLDYSACTVVCCLFKQQQDLQHLCVMLLLPVIFLYQ